MEKSKSIQKSGSGTKICINIYNKPTDSKQYVPFSTDHPRHGLTNILFALARRTWTIGEKTL